MTRPKLFLLGPSHYTYRVEYRFVDSSGELLKSKTWELYREQHEGPQVLLLLAGAKVAGWVSSFDSPTGVPRLSTAHSDTLLDQKSSISRIS